MLVWLHAQQLAIRMLCLDDIQMLLGGILAVPLC